MPRVNTVRFLDFTAGPITGAEALAALESWSDAENMSRSNRKKYRSVVTRALESGTGLQGAALLAATVNPVLFDLPHYAGRIGRSSAWTQNRATAERFIEGVTGLKRSGISRSLPIELRWSTYLRELADGEPRKIQTCIQRLERAIVAAGYSPSDSMELELLEAAGESLGIKTIAKDVTHYRAARERLIAREPSAAGRFGPIEYDDHNTAVGLRTLENLSELLTTAGYAGHADDLTPFEQACILWPLGGEQVKEYISTGMTKAGDGRPSRRISPECRRDASRKFCLITAMLCKYDDPTLLLKDDFGLDALLLADRPNRHARGIGSSTSAFRRKGKVRGTDTVPLLQYLFDCSLAERALNSAYTELFDGSDSAPRYIPAMQTDLEVLWMILQAGFGPELEQAEMLELRVRHRAIRESLRTWMAQPTDEVSGKDKALAVQTVTYDQVVCYILPAFALEVKDAKRAYLVAVREAERAGHNRWTDRDCVKLRKDWSGRSLRYLSLAMPIADGKRDVQYVHGTLSKRRHFVPRLDEQGQLVSLTCRWTRDLSDPAALKDKVGGGVKGRTRVLLLNPAIVDHEILNDWIVDLRIDPLVSSGKIARREDYDIHQQISEGRWALFPSPVKETPSPTHGRTDLSQWMGAALYDGCRRFLGRDLPEWDTRVEKGYRAIFARHISRLLLVSSIGGVYRMWEEAMRLTDDSRQMCEDEYTAVAEEALGRSGKLWDTDRALESVFLPRLAFDAHGRTRDPATFDVLERLLTLDDAAPGTLLPAPLREMLVARRDKRRTKARRGKKEAPHKRRARPELSAALRAVKGDMRRMHNA